MIKLFQPAFIHKMLNNFYFDKTHAANNSIKNFAIFEITDGNVSFSEKKQY